MRVFNNLQQIAHRLTKDRTGKFATGYIHMLAYLAIAAVFSMVLLGAEILPKMVAFAASERLAPLVAVPIRVLQAVSRPVRWFLGVLLIEPLTRILAGGKQADPAVRAEELQPPKLLLTLRLGLVLPAAVFGSVTAPKPGQRAAASAAVVAHGAPPSTSSFVIHPLPAHFSHASG